ncbi:hypothetical protein ACFWXO_21885 [Kitasatospora sp. NPDC059088]|uniref:hypothetical protein n=1 Tax=Kitasatospora sp. NPDC059088 TaxID=3346722 RepID=UPI00367EAA86
MADRLLVLHGGTVLGIDGSTSWSADGQRVTQLPTFATQQTQLLEARQVMSYLPENLDRAFAATRRRPTLLVREPARTSAALLSLRDGILAVGEELGLRDLADSARECQQAAQHLEQLRARICPAATLLHPAPEPARPLPSVELVVTDGAGHETRPPPTQPTSSPTLI